MTVFLFSGQGSQDVGMAREFHDNHEEARAVFDMAEAVSGLPLRRLCFEGPMEELTETGNLQPAMTATVLACYRVFRKTNTIQPRFVAGHSLGEYAALAAADVISDADCIKLVSARGRLMQTQAEAKPGAMAAIMKLDPEVVREMVEKVAQDHTLCMANLNAPGQIVVSGTEEAVEALKAPVAEVRGRFSKLKVSGAWHSPLMKGAEAPFNEVIEGVTFNDAAVPVLLNVTGAPETDGAVIKARMKEQMCTGVRWYPAMEHTWADGARTYLEFGPKSTLTRMLRTIVKEVDKKRLFLISDEEKLAAWQENA